MAIKITGPLTTTQRARINRAASDKQPFYDHSFIHIGRGLYSAVFECQDDHIIARHMMTVAGHTFLYEVT